MRQKTFSNIDIFVVKILKLPSLFNGQEGPDFIGNCHIFSEFWRALIGIFRNWKL